MRWNLDGKVLASGSNDATIKLWALDESGHSHELNELRGHSKRIEKIHWDAKDPMRLLSASEDKAIKNLGHPPQRGACTALTRLPGC